RNRIRRAFVDKAEMRRIAVTRGGATIEATEITVAPFEGDQRLARFPGLAAKRYRFVLADGVPGKVLEIAAEVPGGGGGVGARETMSFEREAPCSGDSGPCAAGSTQ